MPWTSAHGLDGVLRALRALRALIDHLQRWRRAGRSRKRAR
ncbi:MAG TPA: hypothetical protein VFQ48_10920 [Pseudonocardiaceae bacterium]|nr:hypothetical protein [Pseudonocardiaceae bacterium]